MKKRLFITVLFFCTFFIQAQQMARVKGIVLDENNQPVENVSVIFKSYGTTTDASGFYQLRIPAKEKGTLVFSHTSFKKVTTTLALLPNEDFEFNPVLSSKTEQIGEITVIGTSRKRVEGITNVSPVVLRTIPGANAGIENILKTLPGVVSNNELSTQYAVRGGNYDENLVYVNEIEIYRPFLIRSGQQEGLSFTNTTMVENVDFSAGGFQAKYGDKLSSVLDITYRNPKKFGLALEGSFLGGSLTIEGTSKNQKWTTLTGVRYRNNSLLVNSQDTESNYKPTFADLQTQLNYFHNTQWSFSFLGNISQNKYNYQPLTRQTNFGTIDQPIALLVFYQGQEKDAYTTYFGALKSVYQPNDNHKYKFIQSIYHTQEQEHFDIAADYAFGEIDSNIGSDTFGGVVYSQKIGSQLNHARNNLDALISNTEVKGNHTFTKSQVEWGIKYTIEDIRDRIVEWEVVDSAGFSLPAPIIDIVNEQPYHAFTGPMAPYHSIRATNYVTINRISGYGQWNYKTKLSKHQFWITAGMRFQEWMVKTNQQKTNQFIWSPRIQLTLKPKWTKDIIFRLSGGMYYQPPFYRELRDVDGVVQPKVKAQQSYHVVLGNDYSFKMWNRPFKLVSEAYYKGLSDVNTYTLDNVRIRYQANNNATAYVYGADVRLNGEFVSGTESWFSFGYLKTEENQNNRGYIARPTDQRLKFGILFQDYAPNIPNLKLYLNLVYSTGLPGGSPSYADPYLYQSRLRDYRRADVGFSYVFKDASLGQDRVWLKRFQELSVGFEIFNMFNNNNAITNTWVRDAYSKLQYGIPNYMTTRVFNLKFSMKL